MHIADVSFFVRARTTPYPKPLHLILTPYSMPLRLLLYKICVSYDVRYRHRLDRCVFAVGCAVLI